MIRNKISEFETAMTHVDGCLMGKELEEVFPLKHYFTDGAYAREIFLPKGHIIIGKLHRHEHLNFLLKGDVSVLTEEGPERIKAPCTMISPPATKRVVFTHEDTVWVTVHITPERNLEKIEEFVIAKSYEELGLEEPKKDEQLIEEMRKALEGAVKCHGDMLL